MSDGPHRSLPLKRHWKLVAERAAMASYSLSEVADALPNALFCELREAPVAQVIEILSGREQMSLLHDNGMDQLEALRTTCRGSIAGTALIDCAIETCADGLTGLAAVSTALIHTLEALARGFSHSIEEHFRRKKPMSEFNIRTRLREAGSQLSCERLASEIISGSAVNPAKFKVVQHSGIDEGPKL